MKKKWKKGAAFMALLILVSTACRSGIVFAAIKDETVFKDVQWNLIGETPVLQDQGWVQSMCTTDDYIICLENASNRNLTRIRSLHFTRTIMMKTEIRWNSTVWQNM